MAPHFPRRCSHPSRRSTYRPLATRLLPLLALLFAALILPRNALAAQPAGSGWGWNVASAVSQLFSSLRAGIQTAQPTTTFATRSVKPAATGTCDPSSLSGYTSSIALASGLRLHWAVTATSTIQLAVEATRASGAGTGWFAVGWTATSGAMAPADAVMCNIATTPAIKAYRITGYAASQVAATSAFTPGSVTLTAGTTTTIANASFPLTLPSFPSLPYFPSHSPLFPLTLSPPSHHSHRAPLFDTDLSPRPPLPPTSPPSGSPGRRATAQSRCGRGGSQLSHLGLLSPTLPNPLSSHRFTRSTGDGSAVAVDVAGVNSLIWAFSASGSKTVAYHNAHFLLPPFSPCLPFPLFPSLPPFPPIPPFPLPLHSPNRSGSADVDFSCDASASATPAPPPPSTTPPPPPTPPPLPLRRPLLGEAPTALRPPSPATPTRLSSREARESSLLPHLLVNILLLHWKAGSASQLDLAIEATAAPAKSGWISLAWAKGGKMAPSDAVFGNMAGGGVAAYKIGGYSMGSIQRTTAFAIGTANTTTTASGSTVIKFSRTQGTGSAAKVQVAGSNSLLWAYSPSGSESLGFHGGAYGRITVDFSCKTASSGGGSSGGGKGHDDDDNDDDDDDNKKGGDHIAAEAAAASHHDGEMVGESRGRGRVLVNSVTPLATCSPSSLAGFTSSVSLGSNMKLHWKVTTGSLLELAVTATGAAATGLVQRRVLQERRHGDVRCGDRESGQLALPVNTYAVTSYSTVKATTAFGAGSRSFTGGTTATM
ncbi:unnamed protein product, partial [Closterium sp. Yama58-4]